MLAKDSALLMLNCQIKNYQDNIVAIEMRETIIAFVGLG